MIFEDKSSKGLTLTIQAGESKSQFMILNLTAVITRIASCECQSHFLSVNVIIPLAKTLFVEVQFVLNKESKFLVIYCPS